MCTHILFNFSTTLTGLAGRIIPIPATSWTRSLSTEFNGTEVEQSKWTPDVEAPIQSETPAFIPPVNTKLHVVNPEYNDYRFRQYSILRNQSMSAFSSLRMNFFNLYLPERNVKAVDSRVRSLYEPERLVTNPYSPSQITLELLLASQSHLGHATPLWNPRNSRYIFGIRQGIHIISLDVTAAHLRRACRIVTGVAERAGIILFVGTRKGQQRIVLKAAKLAGGCHLFERWTPGTLTNGELILGKCGTRVVDEFDREIPELQDQLEQRPALKPDLVVCLNPLENWVMLHECGMNNIPTIGIIDTDADPSWVTYPIPANDDSLRCMFLICGTLGKAAEEGREIRRKKAHQGIVTYTPTKFYTER